MPLVKQLSVRVTEKLHKAFHRKAKRYGTPTAVHRQILEAFVDNRLTITPDPKKENLYES